MENFMSGNCGKGLDAVLKTFSCVISDSIKGDRRVLK